MAETTIPEPTIFLAFDNEEPIDAGELGKLLRRMSIDYRRATGGKLAVARLQVGSTEMWVTDAQLIGAAVTAVATAVIVSTDAVERVVKFGKQLKQYFKDGEKALPSEYQTLDAAPSAEKIAEIAAKHGANVKFRQVVDANGHHTEFDLSFSEAVRIDERNKRDKKRTKEKHGQQLLRIDVEKLMQIRDATSKETDAVVSAIVHSLTSAGHERLVTQLAIDLEAAGRKDLADIVRKHLPEPPKPRGFLPTR